MTDGGTALSLGESPKSFTEFKCTVYCFYHSVQYCVPE